MILLLDTSTPVCKTYWKNEEGIEEASWQADRKLADKLLSYLRSQLTDRQMSWDDIRGIGIYQGPGSFTGLRISHTIMNTLADDKGIPIVGVTGEDWVEKALSRLGKGENDILVMPQYGREANITKPRK